MTMSDETPVERRLREWVERDDQCEEPEPFDLDCGREAIRLLRDFDRDEVNPADWDVYRRALLARCTEGPR